MKGSITNVSASGIYSCSCGNLETHIHGKSKAPCSKCDKNNEWTLILETEELETILKENKDRWYNILITYIRKRYEKR